jgi:hypothetical protein
MKSMKKILLLLAIGFLLFGCINGLIGDSTPPKSMTFNAAKDTNGDYAGSFSITSEANNAMKPSGEFELKMSNQYETIYYEKKQFKDSDFGTDGKLLFKIEKSKVLKARDEYANLDITVKIGNKTFTKSTEITVDAYTEEEMEKILNDQYQKTAITMGNQITLGDFTIKVASLGLYDSGRDIRFDLEITNNDKESTLRNGIESVSVNDKQLKYVRKSSGGGKAGYFNVVQSKATISGYLVYELPNNGTLPDELKVVVMAQKYYGSSQKYGEPGQRQSDYGKTEDLRTVMTINTKTKEVTSDFKTSEMLEQEYLNNAKIQDQSLEVGDFRIDIVKSGIYDSKYLRIDLTIRNSNSENIDLQSRIESVAVDGEPLKEYKYGGELLSSGHFSTGETKRGYILYNLEDVMPSKVELTATGQKFSNDAGTELFTEKITINTN